MQADAAIDLGNVVSHLVEFVGAFMAAGAVGFRYAVLRGRLNGGDPVYRAASRRGAAIGVVGALLGAWHVAEVLPRFAARQHVDVLQVPLTNLPMGIWVAGTALAILGFLAAALGARAGWHAAVVGVVAGSLRNLVTGELERVITPSHVLVGGLWIGTLLVLLAAGLPAVFRHAARERRGAAVAEMVNAFSPLALTTGVLVVLLGLVLAFREVGSVDGLLGTPYGNTLIVKVLLVSVVFGLGAWNWRRQRPRLGDESAALAVRRSATMELAVAFLVLVTTAVMVGFPAPAEAEERGGPPPAAAPGAPSASAPAGAPQGGG